MTHNEPFVQFGLYILGNEIFNIVVQSMLSNRASIDG